MALFDKAKDKKAAEEAARKARIAEYEKKAAESKVKQATERAKKAEEELKDMKAAKVTQDAKRRAMQAGVKPTPGMGGPVPGIGRGPKVIATYTVKKGDTLGQIAKQFYGVTGPKYWNLIQAANKDLIKDVNKIDIGQVFKIPELPIELRKK